MSEYAIIDKLDLQRMIGIPASVGVCEPIEGFVERPDFVLGCMKDMAKECDALRQKLEQAEARADACQQQAQIWKQEARTQSAIVAEMYQELTGKTGEPGDWNGVRPLKPAILRKQAEAIECWLHGEPEMGDLSDYANHLRQKADETEHSNQGTM